RPALPGEGVGCVGGRKGVFCPRPGRQRLPGGCSGLIDDLRGVNAFAVRLHAAALLPQLDHRGGAAVPEGNVRQRDGYRPTAAERRLEISIAQSVDELLEPLPLWLLLTASARIPPARGKGPSSSCLPLYGKHPRRRAV